MERMKLLRRGPAADIAFTLLLASAVSLLLYALTIHRMGQYVFTYLPANLALAWIPIGLAVWLSRVLRDKLWSSWRALSITTLWLIFLPNSFYVITDLIHLENVYRGDLVATSVTFFAFAFTGLLLGYASLFVIHERLRERMAAKAALSYVAGVVFVCSLAIYVGRDLRWNSWDVLVSPAGLLFDLSDRLIHPSEYHTIFAVAGGFFILLFGMYVALLRAIRAVAKSPLL
jgi:uncharacterized membrane protein